MARRALVAVPLILFLSALLLASVRAQDETATPSGSVLPLGVSIVPLIAADLGDLPATSSQLQVSRLTLQPGTSIPSATLPGSSLIFVEVGTLTASCDTTDAPCEVIHGPSGGAPTSGATPAAGTQSVTIQPGDSLQIPPGVSSTLRNDGSDPLSLLVIVIGAAAPAGTPVS